MPDPSLVPASSSSISTLTWFNRRFAEVLGLNPAVQPLAVERLGERKSDQELRTLAGVIDKRFRRVVNDVTGAVTVEVRSDVPEVNCGEEDTDPVVVQTTKRYLDAADDAVSAVDTDLCVPGVCAGQVKNIVWQSKETIGMLKKEARHPRRGAFQSFIYLDELLDDKHGLLPQLCHLIEEHSAEEPTIQSERAITSINVAAQALGAFEEAVRTFIQASGEEPGVGELADFICRCAGSIPLHAEQVRQGFYRIGIGDGELQNVELPLKTVSLSERKFKSITLDEALDALRTEPTRWPPLVKRGGNEQFRSVRESALVLNSILEGLEREKIFAALSLPEQESWSGPGMDNPVADLAFRMDRMSTYTGSALETIIGASASTTAVYQKPRLLSANGSAGQSEHKRKPHNAGTSRRRQAAAR